MQTQNKGKIFILTGERDIGKTVLCMRLIRHFRSLSIQVKGLVSPAKNQDQKKLGLTAQDIETGNTRDLAVFNSHWKKLQHFMKWKFVYDTFKWGNEVLNKIKYADLLVIDELGILEFNRNEGWLAGIELLDSGNFIVAVVVIRLELIGAAKKRWPRSKISHLSASNKKELEKELKQDISKLLFTD